MWIIAWWSIEPEFVADVESNELRGLRFVFWSGMEGKRHHAGIPSVWLIDPPSGLCRGELRPLVGMCDYREATSKKLERRTVGSRQIGHRHAGERCRLISAGAAGAARDKQES